MRSVFALGLAALAGICAAQDVVQADYPYRIDPDTVDESTRAYWCQQNQAQCPLICLQQPGVNSMSTTDNTCDSDTLAYSCVCENGVSPNITQYSQTLPFFICQEWGNQCVKGCNGINTCADACRADHPCGAQTPYLGNSSILATMSSTQAPSGSATNRVPVTGFGGATSTSTPGTGAAPGNFLPSAGLGLAAIFSSVFFGFAILM